LPLIRNSYARERQSTIPFILLGSYWGLNQKRQRIS